MWGPKGVKVTPVQGGNAQAATTSTQQVVPPTAQNVPANVQQLLINPLDAQLRDVSGVLTAPLDTKTMTASTSRVVKQSLINAALAFATEIVVSGSIKGTLAASTTAAANGGGIALAHDFPFSLLEDCSLKVNQFGDVVSAGGWLLFQENLAMSLPGIDPRQQKHEGVLEVYGGQSTVPSTYSVSATVDGSAASLTPGGAPVYNTTTAAVPFVVDFTFSLVVPFVNNFDEFLGLLPSAAQDLSIAMQYTFAQLGGGNAASPLFFVSGADITGSSSVTASGYTATVTGEEFFLSAPPAGYEATYQTQSETVCQRFQDSGFFQSTGRKGAYYVAPQGGYILRMIGDLRANYLAESGVVDNLRMIVDEFTRPETYQLASYVAMFYRRYGRLPDVGIMMWDGTYTSLLPNSGDSMGWIDATTSIKPTMVLDINSTATLGNDGSNTFNVLRTRLVRAGAA